jgi:hypothetical protein
MTAAVGAGVKAERPVASRDVLGFHLVSPFSLLTGGVPWPTALPAFGR